MGVLPRDVIPTIGKGGKYGYMADVEYPPSQHYREKKYQRPEKNGSTLQAGRTMYQKDLIDFDLRI
jgi:hypothetical protein